MRYTIDEFWKARLTGLRTTAGPLVQGWEYVERGVDNYVEAPLSVADAVPSTGDPDNCSILLVSAAGAVGKTTLARQVAHSTQSIYIDLARTQPVAGNTLTGGLVNSHVYDDWKVGETTVLIDALDESRLHTTWAGFQAFLDDVAKRSRGRKIPTVVF